MLQIMALSILRDLVHRIKSSVFYSIMADETADASNREQIVIVIRHVSDELVPHEEFTGLAKVPSIDANTVKETTEDSLLRMNLSLKNCRGQCYDGASNMTGVKKGVASQISSKEPRAIFTHCYGHALNLAVGDTVKQSKLMRDAFNTTHEISKLLKYSPKRDSLIECLKQNIAPETQGFRTLCPTRWTVRAASLKSVIDNYTVLQELWDECDTNDSDIRARILGVSAQMGTFNYLFGFMLGYEILRHTDNLSKALQQEALTASEGQELGKLAIECLLKMRNDIKFDHFWEKVEAVRINVDVVEPAVPRKRKVPERFQVGNGEYSFPVTVKEVYRPQYFEALDLAVTGIQERFDQPGYRVLQNIEDLLIKASQPGTTADFVTELEFVCKFYGEDLHKDRLTLQLETLQAHFHNEKLKDTNLNVLLWTLSLPAREMFSKIVTLVKILLVILATNASSERTFSALRRIKTYLRTTMTQARLNHLMMLHIHCEETDSLDLKAVAKEFIQSRERRRIVFGDVS